MSSCRNRRYFLRTAAAALALTAAGCGFRPLYGRKARGEVDAELARVKVGIIADREGQQLHNYLLDRINRKGRPSSPDYLLSVSIRIEKIRQAFEPDKTATRMKLVFTADFELQEITTEKVLLKSFARSVSSYNIVDSAIATRSAELDTIDRAARAVSEEIRMLLSLYFQRRTGTAET
jgi:LPS-assembly lipoprotein